MSESEHTRPASPPAADEGLQPELDWTPNYPRIRRADEIWFRIEKTLCGAMFLAMALMVFASVVADVFGTRREWSDLLVLFVVCFGAMVTRERKDGEAPRTLATNLAFAVGLTVGIGGLVYLYTERHPGGFVWAQKLALVMMLWVALLGASMATYERAHLALEFGEKIWPKKVVHLVKALAHAVTSLFCVLMFWLSLSLVLDHWDWSTQIEANRWLPTWLALAILPYTFLAMAVRILAQSFTVATRQARPAEEQLPT